MAAAGFQTAHIYRVRRAPGLPASRPPDVWALRGRATWMTLPVLAPPPRCFQVTLCVRGGCFILVRCVVAGRRLCLGWVGLSNFPHWGRAWSPIWFLFGCCGSGMVLVVLRFAFVALVAALVCYVDRARASVRSWLLTWLLSLLPSLLFSWLRDLFIDISYRASLMLWSCRYNRSFELHFLNKMSKLCKRGKGHGVATGDRRGGSERTLIIIM
jgi:hypothetical protein